MWIILGHRDPFASFLHELCHFQFIHYWRNDPSSAVSQLSNNQFEYLKESLTIIIDDDLLGLVSLPDKGYDMHQEFRCELEKVWKKDKDFEQLVQYGVEHIGRYTN